MLLAACGGSATTSVTSPSSTATRCQLSFDATPRSFAAAGGTGSVAVTVARECSWSASSGVGWVAITAGAQGQGDGTVTFDIAGNLDPIVRQGALTIGEGRVELTQQPAECRFDVSRPPATVGSAGGALPAQIRTHSACDWSTTSEVSWVTVAPATGRGDADLSLTVGPNDGAERAGMVVLAGQRLPLTQAAVSTPAPPSPPSPTPTPTPTPTPPPPAPAPPVPPPTPAPPPPPSEDVHLEGSLRDLSGRCPTVRFTVEGIVVTTSDATKFKGGSCRDLRSGDAVEVKGKRLVDGSVSASEVRRDEK
jgi:Domain of unknown function (DUF5666)/Putative binding domain, N-terminal/Viral BACON domain